MQTAFVGSAGDMHEIDLSKVTPLRRLGLRGFTVQAWCITHSAQEEKLLTYAMMARCGAIDPCSLWEDSFRLLTAALDDTDNLLREVKEALSGPHGWEYFAKRVSMIRGKLNGDEIETEAQG